MNIPALRKLLAGYLLLMVPFTWLAMKYERYNIDGDAVAYMDIADLLHAHRWADAVNGYWHPLYPALLWMAQVVFHTSRGTELAAYYAVNFVLFWLQVAAMLAFVGALEQLRKRMSPGVVPVLSLDSMRLIGLALLLISMMRELSLADVRTDGLLQVLILFGLAMLMRALASKSLVFAPMMGVFFGLAYLTKSFALVLMLLAVGVLFVFGWLVQKRSAGRMLAHCGVVLVCFSVLAAPFIAALSHQKHRFDFGDSGALNYAWYVSGTEKMHLEPWMTKDFGSASVHLVHPEQQLLASPGVYSYKALRLGTYPAWFDTTYFNERIVPKFSLYRLISRDTRNFILVFRYIVNHPEPLILLALLLLAGATLRGSHKFAWPAVALGIAMWCIYGMVNIEERYVTVAYFAILLPLFLALRTRGGVPANEVHLRSTAAWIVVLFAALALFEVLRVEVLARRDEIIAHQMPAWRNPAMFGVAEGLAALGVKSGDEVACVGTTACLYDNYWARLAGTRILTEIYQPDDSHLIDRLGAMPNCEQVIETVRNEHARVLVGSFDPGEMNPAHPASAGWLRLGSTNFYALPLNAR